MFEKMNINKLFGKKEFQTSLFFSKLKTFFVSNGKEELFSHIKKVKINGGNFTIETNKPIVNTELKHFYSDIVNIAKETINIFWIKFSGDIKIIFK